MTPNDVNEKRNTIVAAAVIAGRMSGSEIRVTTLPARRSERRGGVLHVGRQVLPQRPDDSDHDGDVEGDVCTDHRPDGAIEGVGEQRQESRHP